MFVGKKNCFEIVEIKDANWLMRFNSSRRERTAIDEDCAFGAFNKGSISFGTACKNMKVKSRRHTTLRSICFILCRYTTTKDVENYTSLQ